jgi:hypothetical protein
VLALTLRHEAEEALVAPELGHEEDDQDEEQPGVLRARAVLELCRDLAPSPALQGIAAARLGRTLDRAFAGNRPTRGTCEAAVAQVTADPVLQDAAARATIERMVEEAIALDGLAR